MDWPARAAVHQTQGGQIAINKQELACLGSVTWPSVEFMEPLASRSLLSH